MGQTWVVVLTWPSDAGSPSIGRVNLVNQSGSDLVVWTSLAGSINMTRVGRDGVFDSGPLGEGLWECWAVNVNWVETWNAENPGWKYKPESWSAASNPNFRSWDGQYACQPGGPAAVFVIV